MSNNTTEQINNLKKEMLEMQKNQEATNKQLLDALTMLTQMISQEKVNKPTDNLTPAPVKKYEKKEYSGAKKPQSDDFIQVMSLCKGELNLCVNGIPVLRFKRYGDINPVLYSTLVDIVNQNRRFAQEGYFYIMDEGAVYHLGLASYYEHIVTADVLNNIDSYSEDEVKSIVSNMCENQKTTLIKIIADKVYSGERVDHNKVDIICKICNADIQSKVRQMREFTRSA